MIPVSVSRFVFPEHQGVLGKTTNERNMSGLTEAIGKFIAGSHGPAIPSDALDVAKLGITDTVACMIAGRDEPVVHIVKSMVSPGKSNDRARLLFTDDHASSWDALSLIHI